MANMIRKVRFSIGLGEMHSTYVLLEDMKREGGLSDPYLESMRITLKRKLMEEEEGLLTIAYEVRSEPKPRKYGLENLGFTEPQIAPTSSSAVNLNDAPAFDDPSYMDWLAAKVAAAKSEGKTNQGDNHE